MLDGMLKYWQRIDEGKPAHEVAGIRLDAWVIAQNPSIRELDELVQMDGLKRDLLQDALDPNEVPRVQDEDGIVYFFLRAPSGQGEAMLTVPLLIALSSTFVVSISRMPFTWLEQFHAEGHYTTNWRSQLVWRILLALNARYQAAITDLSRRVRWNIETGHVIKNEDILRLITYEAALNDLLAAVMPMQTMMANIASGKYIKTYPEDKDLMEDVQLGVTQVVGAAQSQLKTTINMREAYSVIATNNLNRIIKFLTLATVALTVPMVVSGLYGMNVRLPFGEHPAAFFIILGSAAAFVVAALMYLWHKKLL
ncbi:MAG TPA: magnesium transporter CorA family protein [Candidatus Paceibacterota bacterium]|nr:magnesium transporter CorA family protein [Candidatus Paceibacterota bacterium]